MVLNGKCVTVVAYAGVHFRAFYLLTFAASHDLKETIILIYCFLQGLRGRFPVNKLNPKFTAVDFRQPYTTGTTLHGSGAHGMPY